MTTHVFVSVQYTHGLVDEHRLHIALLESVRDAKTLRLSSFGQSRPFSGTTVNNSVTFEIPSTESGADPAELAKVLHALTVPSLKIINIYFS